MSTDLVTRRATPPVHAADPLVQDDPRFELWLGAFVVLVFIGGFLLWASFARMDAAAVASGQVAVSGHRQTIQHREGGTVAAVLVREGQHVNAGQLLIAIKPADVGAQERSTLSLVIGLQAQRARLIAERLGQSTFAAPAEFAALTGDEKAEADQAVRLQRADLATRSRAIASQKAVLHRRSAQSNEQIAGYGAQVASAEAQSGLIGEELSGTKGLAAKGYASVNRVRALQRTQADLLGQKASYASEAARARAQIAENDAQAITLDSQRMQDVGKELHEVEVQLNDSLPKLVALKEQLRGTEIRAPVSGQIVGLTVFNVGAVVAPGQKLMDIVPDQAPVLIEAQVSPADADDLHVGQETEVKVQAFHERNLPVLKGEITRLSADSFNDEKSGQRYFTADVTVAPEELKKVAEIRGRDSSLKPGLPVQIMVPLRKRTALQYMLEPLTQAFWRSFHEH